MRRTMDTLVQARLQRLASFVPGPGTPHSWQTVSTARGISESLRRELQRQGPRHTTSSAPPTLRQLCACALGRRPFSARARIEDLLRFHIPDDLHAHFVHEALRAPGPLREELLRLAGRMRALSQTLDLSLSAITNRGLCILLHADTRGEAGAARGEDREAEAEAEAGEAEAEAGEAGGWVDGKKRNGGRAEVEVTVEDWEELASDRPERVFRDQLDRFQLGAVQSLDLSCCFRLAVNASVIELLDAKLPMLRRLSLRCSLEPTSGGTVLWALARASLAHLGLLDLSHNKLLADEDFEPFLRQRTGLPNLQTIMFLACPLLSRELPAAIKVGDPSLRTLPA